MPWAVSVIGLLWLSAITMAALDDVRKKISSIEWRPTYLSLNRGFIDLKNAKRIPLRVQEIPLPAGARKCPEQQTFQGQPARLGL
jgi:hypothetical protein